MSTKQVVSSKNVTNKTDFYSLVVVLWQMVSGRKPYDQNELSVTEIQVSIIKKTLPLLNFKSDQFIQKTKKMERIDLVLAKNSLN